MAPASGQRLIVVILFLVLLSGGGVLGYRIMKEYPEFVSPPAVEKPIQLAEPLPQKPVVVTEKAPIGKLEKKEKEKFQAALKININTASAEELEKIPYVGPARAKAIIAARPYQSIEDIMNASRFGPGIFPRIKDYITVGVTGLAGYKPPRERTKAPASEKKVKIIKVDTDGDGIPDTWITRPQ